MRGWWLSSVGSLLERARSLTIREGLRVEPLLLCIERSQMGYLIRTPPWKNEDELGITWSHSRKRMDGSSLRNVSKLIPSTSVHFPLNILINCYPSIPKLSLKTVRLWIQVWVIFHLKGYVWCNKPVTQVVHSWASVLSDSKTLHIKSTTIQAHITSCNWKTRKQAWQIFVCFYTFSFYKPNTVIAFEDLTLQRATLDFFGEKASRFASQWNDSDFDWWSCCTTFATLSAPLHSPFSFLTTHLSLVKPTEAQKLLTAAPPHLWHWYGFQWFLNDYLGHFILISSIKMSRVIHLFPYTRVKQDVRFANAVIRALFCK